MLFRSAFCLRILSLYNGVRAHKDNTLIGQFKNAHLYKKGQFQEKVKAHFAINNTGAQDKTTVRSALLSILDPKS